MTWLVRYDPKKVDLSINESSFPKDQDIRKGEVMVVPHSEKEVERL